MSIIGQSFNGGTDGALVNFDVGNAANLFTGGFTIACLAKMQSTNWGMLGGYSDAVGSTFEGAFFISDNSGGRLFSIDDFTAGFPSTGSLGSPGLSDDVWRWLVISKPAGAAHYRYHYADLATLTWVHGESASSSNHDNHDPVVAFSTWSIYAMGFDSGDMAALAAWDSELSDGSIEAALTQLAQDLVDSAPAIGWLFPEASSGSAVSDFTGGGGDETLRQLIATSDDPTDFDFTVDTGGPLVDSKVFAFADGNAGHSCDLGSAPAVGDWDVLCVNSDTTVTTPSGFTREDFHVGNQGAYIFTRQAAGGEGSTVTVTTAGDFNAIVSWSRWTGLNAVDTTAVTTIEASSTNATPTHSTGALAESGEVVIAFAALHAIATANQATPVWSAGYTGVTAEVQGTGGHGVVSYVAYKTNAGTAAEAPAVTWSHDAIDDRYMLTVSFTNGAGGATVHPSTIAAVAAMPSASKSTGSTVSPSAIAASTTMPAAAKSTGSTVSPAVVAAVTSLPAGATRVGSTVSPSTVAAVAALPGAAAGAGSSVHPSAIAAVASLPAASISSTGDATVNPATIAARAAFPAARVSSGVTASVRLGGVLVQTSLRGVVRHDGASVAFG